MGIEIFGILDIYNSLKSKKLVVHRRSHVVVMKPLCFDRKSFFVFWPAQILLFAQVDR